MSFTFDADTKISSFEVPSFTFVRSSLDIRETTEVIYDIPIPSTVSSLGFFSDPDASSDRSAVSEITFYAVVLLGSGG